MRVALFVPCYIDQLRPRAGLAALELLEEQGIEAALPEGAVCCGQPFLTAGSPDRARALAARYVEVFAGFDWVVTPSGSCAATMRVHLPHLVAGEAAARVAERSVELCEFLVRVVGVEGLGGRLARRVGLHTSCHGLRELRLGNPSESREPPRVDPARRLLESVEGLTLVEPSRPDECCGFGGVFAVEEPEVSCRMGEDRLADHRSAGADCIASTDVSCLLHLDGVARRGPQPLPVLHVAELLSERAR